MKDIGCNEIIGALKREFGSLWECKPRGDTLEIVTPYLYHDNSFVSVFVTQRPKKRIIVSDAGHLEELVVAESDDAQAGLAFTERLSEQYKVKSFTKAKITYRFKECSDVKLLPSLIFDLCNFLTAASNVALATSDQQDREDGASFRRKADTFINAVNKAKGRRVKFNVSLPEIKEATFSAVVTENSKLWLVIYLTGSHISYFQRTVSKAIIDTEFAVRSSLKDHIKATIPLLDVSAGGYKPERLKARLHLLGQVAKQEPITLNDRESFKRALSV